MTKDNNLLGLEDKIYSEKEFARAIKISLVLMIIYQIQFL